MSSGDWEVSWGIGRHLIGFLLREKKHCQHRSRNLTQSAAKYYTHVQYFCRFHVGWTEVALGMRVREAIEKEAFFGRDVPRVGAVEHDDRRAARRDGLDRP